MRSLDKIIESVRNFGLFRVSINVGDMIEIIILSVLFYYILVWVKNTRAWALVKGLIVILAFVFLAYLLQMSTILWIAKNLLSFAVIGFIVVLQPEFRKALEQLGRNNFFKNILPFENGRVHGESADIERLLDEIAKACSEMSKARTGALIVLECQEKLAEYIGTGIDVDAICTSQLLINIFEHNTPLHDGAVIISENRIAAATCYLPVSHSDSISKEFGTRHRAAVGMSEETDSVIIIVSEETGRISCAFQGNMKVFKDAQAMRDYVQRLLIKTPDTEGKLKGKRKGEKLIEKRRKVSEN